MRLSPTDSNNYEITIKSSVLSKTFSAGTMELLRNVLGGPNPYDYRNKDGDTLLLSSSGKKQITREDILAVAQKFYPDEDIEPAERIPQAVKDFFTQYAPRSGKGTNTVSTDQVPDSVTKFFKEHSFSDLLKIPLDQISDDVKSSIKEQLLSPVGMAGMSQDYLSKDGIRAINSDDTARKLVNSLFVNASSGIANSSISNEDLLKLVKDSLDRTFEGLNETSGDLSLEVKDKLNLVYQLAQQKIERWASANGLRT